MSETDVSPFTRGKLSTDGRGGAPVSPGLVAIAGATTNFQLLSDLELDEIHLASLEVLRRTGVCVHDSEALELLSAAGCVVTEQNRVRFPAGVVEDALASAPSCVTLCKRSGEPHMYLEGGKTYFGTGSDLPNTLDLETEERRLSLLADVRQTARLVDALPNLDFVMSMALPSDVPPEISDRASFLAMAQNTVKPIVFTAWDESGLADIIHMAEVITGGPHELRLNPFLLAYLEPTSPLQHTQTVIRKLFMMVDHGLPFVYAPGMIDGATAPVTTSGAIVQANAEILSGLAITQLRRKGAPFVWGAGSGPMDMHTMLVCYSTPEAMLHNMAMAELARRLYHLPVWGYSGCSDSKMPDMQAGIESTLWILWTALSGANLVHDIGYIESGLTCSYEMIVICDEVISFVRRMLGGLNLSPEHLALDAIDKVGPGGAYLTSAHTARHFKEVWYPRVFDRRTHRSWEQAGRPDALKNARELARNILASHTPSPLPAGISAQLEAILASAGERLKAA